MIRTLANIFKDSQGLAIGVQHRTSAIPNFLTDLTALWNRLNVRRIYTEDLRKEGQKALDTYYREPDEIALTNIGSFFTDQDDYASYLRFLKEAKISSMKCVAIDIQPRPSDEVALEHGFKNSDAFVNSIWADQIVAGQIQEKGRYVVIAGNFHMRELLGTPHFDDEIPEGTLPALLGIPFITIEVDGRFQDFGLKGNEVHVDKPDNPLKGHLNVTLSKDYKSRIYAPIQESVIMAPEFKAF